MSKKYVSLLGLQLFKLKTNGKYPDVIGERVLVEFEGSVRQFFGMNVRQVEVKAYRLACYKSTRHSTGNFDQERWYVTQDGWIVLDRFGSGRCYPVLPRELSVEFVVELIAQFNQLFDLAHAKHFG